MNVLVKLLAVSMIAGSVALVAGPAHAEQYGPDLNGCTGRVDDAHISSGSPGRVIVKAYYWCDRSHVRIDSHLQLFWCGDKYPQKNESWLQNNCSSVGYNDLPITDTNIGQQYVRYAPPSGTPGPNAQGWYLGCSIWWTTWNGRESPVHMTFSTNPFYKSGGPVGGGPVEG